MKITDARKAPAPRARLLARALVLVAAAVFVAAALVPARSAFAEDAVTTIMQSDFNSSNEYPIEAGGSYKLGEDVTGTIVIDAPYDVTLDLGGHTVTRSASLGGSKPPLYIDATWSDDYASYVVKNGTLIQEVDGEVAISIGRANSSVALDELTASSTNATCVELESMFSKPTTVTISGVTSSYTCTNTSGSNGSVFDVDDGTIIIDQQTGSFTINGDGSIVTVDKLIGCSFVTLKGGTYNKFPTDASIVSGYAMFKSSSATTWSVMLEESAREQALNGGSVEGWSVLVDGFGTVYFDSESEANAFATEKGSTVNTVAVARVGTTYYATLKAAVKAAIASGDADAKAELIANTTEGISVGNGESVSIDLGGFTLTAPDTDEGIFKSGTGTVNVSNGSISTSRHACVYVSGTTAASATVNLEGVKATSASTSAVQCLTGTVNIKSGEYTGSDASNGYAVELATDAVVNIEGGSFTGGCGTDVNVGSSKGLTVTGGDFSVASAVNYLTSEYALQYKNGRYYVVDASTAEATNALLDASDWRLTASNGACIYYGTDDAAKTQAESDKATLSGSTLVAIYHVTFANDDGTTAEKRNYVAGDTFGTLPSEGTREDNEFLGWYNGNEKAVSTNKVPASGTYTAKWNSLGAAKIGTTYYSSLQAALDAAKGGDTVVLLKDVSGEFTVDKSADDDFTLDLNGNTITHSGNHYFALEIAGSSKLTVEGGEIESNGGKNSYACIECEGGNANLTLRNVTLTSSGNAVRMQDSGGTLTIASGAVLEGDYRAASVYKVAVNIEDGAKIYGDLWAWVSTVTVSGGWFSSNIVDYQNLNANNITGGSFGNDSNRSIVASGYMMKGPDIDGRYTVVRDTVAPVIGLENGKLYDGEATFTVTDDNDVTVKVGDVELKPGVSGDYTLSAETLEGVEEGAITVTATDVNGNTSSVEVTWYKAHEWSAWTDAEDGAHHARTCSRCGQTETADHNGIATCVAAATCEDCGATYGSTDPDNHVGTESTEWEIDETGHCHVCSACQQPWDGKTEHTLSWVVTKEPTYTEKGHEHQVCSVCGYTCNETDIDALVPGAPVINGIADGGCYDGTTTFTVAYDGDDLVVKANDTELTAVDGVYTLPFGGDTAIAVTASGRGGTAQISVHSYENHAWGEWQSLANGTHMRACTHEGCAGVERGTCEGDPATCVSESTCSSCGYKLADVDPSNHAGPISSEWAHDDSSHWHICQACNAEANKADHKLKTKSDADGHWKECECGYVTEKTGHALTWKTSKEATATEDGLKVEVCEDCGYKTGKTEVIPKTGVTVTMFRLYNPYTGEHLYTSSTVERDSLKSVGWSFEGEAWTAPSSSKTPVYRLYNPYAEGGDHFYTTSEEEYETRAAQGWSKEGVAWYSDDAQGVPIYRQYNPYAASGTHNYTASKTENDYLKSLGWNEEGVAWYGVK